jgi:hypothetical protein
VKRIALVLLGLMACDRVSDFDTSEGEAYCGQITLASAYRAGFSPRVQMKMTFASTALEEGTSPGNLTTYDAGDETLPNLVLDAPLRAIPALEHDPLSQLAFGDGRDRNMIYAVTPVPDDEEALLAVISLRSDDSIEVRLLRAGRAAAPGAEATPGREPLFGLFRLERREGGCGF